MTWQRSTGNLPRQGRPAPRVRSPGGGTAPRRDSRDRFPNVGDLWIARGVTVRPPQHALRQDFNDGPLPEEGQAELLHWLEEGLDDRFLGFPEGEQSVPTPVKVIVDDAGVTLDGGAGERLRRDANRIGQAQGDPRIALDVLELAREQNARCHQDV